MPPSPRLSAFMMKPRYFTETTMVSDQKIKESTPWIFSGAGAAPWSPLVHSCSV
jgi:hypothetical protein